MEPLHATVKRALSTGEKVTDAVLAHQLAECRSAIDQCETTAEAAAEPAKTTIKQLWYFLRPFLMVEYILQHPEEPHPPSLDVHDVLKDIDLGDDGLVVALYTHRRAAGTARRDAAELDPGLGAGHVRGAACPRSGAAFRRVVTLFSTLQDGEHRTGVAPGRNGRPLHGLR